jgi:GDP/UDP-N,N'-diacetylbacillosamine 2-epimerase (hydrolysing)
MSHLHFVAAEDYRKRVVQLGENPNQVFKVGGLGIDNIVRLKLLNREELEDSLDFKLGSKNLLITFHPVTLDYASAFEQMSELLTTLEKMNDVNFIFTMPNSDTDGRILFQMIENWVKLHPNTKAFTSLGQLRYLSTIKFVDGVVGNSSSGLTEVPSFKKGTVNIGDRQRGRLKANSVIDCEPKDSSIRNAIAELYSKDFQKKLTTVKNPYGLGGASESIVKILEEISLDEVLKKTFFNLDGIHKKKIFNLNQV